MISYSLFNTHVRIAQYAIQTTPDGVSLDVFLPIKAKLTGIATPLAQWRWIYFTTITSLKTYERNQQRGFKLHHCSQIRSGEVGNIVFWAKQISTVIRFKMKQKAYSWTTLFCVRTSLAYVTFDKKKERRKIRAIIWLPCGILLSEWRAWRRSFSCFVTSASGVTFL